MPEADKTVKILYQNYRGEIGWRTILIERIWFGNTEFHPVAQWFLDAIDMDRPGEYRRSFAIKDIFAWKFPEEADVTRKKEDPCS